MLRKRKYIVLTAVLLIAAFLRFALITELPPPLYPDEAANGNNALEALRSGNFKIFYPENNGREGLFINIQALSLALFGPEPWALRIVSALFGSLTVLGIYLLGRELFRSSRLTPLLAAFFLATSFWHINFSRIGFRAIMVPLLATFSLWWLLRSIRTGKLWSAIAGGIAFGLGFHTYIAFRLMPFVAAIPMLAALRDWRRGSGTAYCTPCILGVFLFAAFVAALPIGIYFLNHPLDFLGRGSQVSIFSGESPLWEFAKSNVLTLGMFHIWGDCNLRHNLNCEPELVLPVGIAFIVGVALAARALVRRPSPARPSAALLLGWLFLMALPATLTREGLPHALRSIGMIPPAMLLAAWGAAWLWEAVTGLLDRASVDPSLQPFLGRMRRIRKELALIAIAVLLWMGYAAYRDYFVRFAPGPETEQAFSADLWRQGQYLRALPDGIEKYVVVNLTGDDIRGVAAPAQAIMFATDTFDEERRALQRFRYVKRVEDISIDPATPVVIIPMNGRDRDTRRAIQERFPWLMPAVPRDFLVFRNFAPEER